MRRFLRWWCERRIASTWDELHLRLSQRAAAPKFVANQLENIDRLERRVIALS